MSQKHIKSILNEARFEIDFVIEELYKVRELSSSKIQEKKIEQLIVVLGGKNVRKREEQLR